MAYAIMRTEKIKSKGCMSAKYKHNNRDRETFNADKEKQKLNEELIPQKYHDDYVQAFDRKIGELEYYKTHAVRKDAVLGVEVLLTHSSDSQVNLNQWKADNVKWLQDTFGKDNVLSAKLHLDEQTPHIHAFVVPIDDKGKLNCKAFLGGKEKLRKLQDSYADAMKKYNLERGVKGSVAKHQDIQRFYGAVKEALEQELPEVQKKIIGKENVEQYRMRANETYKTVHLQAIANDIRQNRKRVLEDTKKLQEKHEYAKMVREYQTMKKEFPSIKAKADAWDTLKKGLNNLKDKEYSNTLKHTLQDIMDKQEQIDKARQTNKIRNQSHGYER